MVISNTRNKTHKKNIRKPEYMGHTVNFRTKKLSNKDKNSVHNSPEGWIVFENTQEAIVDEETWLTVQKIRETKHRPSKKGDINPLTGLVYCADCGAKMFNHRTNGYEKKDKNGNPTGKYTNAQDNYTCSTYSKAKSKFENRCTQHHVRTDVIRDLLLDVIKATSTYVMEHEAEFIEKVRSATELQQESEAKALKKRLSKEQKRIDELNTLIKKIYEDNVNGKLSDKRFEMLLADYEADKSTGDRIQQIDIYLKYVGKLDVPMPELTPEQIKEEERKRSKRAWNRTYWRRRKEREQAKREAKEKELSEAVG